MRTATHIDERDGAVWFNLAMLSLAETLCHSRVQQQVCSSEAATMARTSATVLVVGVLVGCVCVANASWPVAAPEEINFCQYVDKYLPKECDHNDNCSEITCSVNLGASRRACARFGVGRGVTVVGHCVVLTGVGGV